MPAGSEAAGLRIPVFSLWHREFGPPLSLGILVEAGRSWRGGALAQRYEFRPPETAEAVLEQLRVGSGPAVLLCSNYIWSIAENLSVARRAVEIRPEIIVLHGGPNTPKYEQDIDVFLAANAACASILVRGEGEVILCEILEALGPTLPDWSVRQLAGVRGVTALDRSGERLATADAPRMDDLDSVPSPYLSGLFDEVDHEWSGVFIETNRGCPFGCTFCDWGSATLSRVRKFDIHRVKAEIDWAARHAAWLHICDANFGMVRRDVEIAEHIAQTFRSTGRPSVVSFTPTKNTSKWLVEVTRIISSCGIEVYCPISLQTVDEATLQAVHRANISTTAYLDLAQDLRRHGVIPRSEVILGLPGQTYSSYKADLQFFIDHDISPRTWLLRMLVNSPMNEPSYRERFKIEANEQGMVLSTSTMSAEDRKRMKRLRRAQVIATQYRTLVHVLRVLQWDYDADALEVLERMIEVLDREPARYPLTSWLFEYFDLHPSSPVGWRAFGAEIRSFIRDELHIKPNSDIDAVLRVQRSVMPGPGQSFPVTVTLEHDYAAYLNSAVDQLVATGVLGSPIRPLRDFGPGQLTVLGDPASRGRDGVPVDDQVRNEVVEGLFWSMDGAHLALMTEPSLDPTALLRER